MTREHILDLDFVEARHKLIDLGAFLDRVARATGSNDFRIAAFDAAIAELAKPESRAVERLLFVFSEPTAAPIPAATTKAACGAWPGAV